MRRDKKTLTTILTVIMMVSILMNYNKNVKAQSITNEINNDSTAAFANNIEGKFAIGASCSFAVKKDGTLWAWGSNYNGKIGDGTNENKSTPVQIMTDVSSVYNNSYNTSFAIKNDNSLWAWGQNDYGQVGDGTKINRNTPIKIMDNVVSFSCSSNSVSFAIKNDNSLWAWGNNAHGQIGDGTKNESLLPIKIMENVKFVTSAKNHTFAIKNDNSLWSWGSNTYGILGNGTEAERLTPVKIMDDVETIEIGYGIVSSVKINPNVDYVLVLKRDGSVWSWGTNINGQLGDGTTKSRAEPKKILDNVSKITTKNQQCYAITKDGSLLIWGFTMIWEWLYTSA